MAPRNYQMRRRAEAMAETRRRIVEATLALHAERGIAATRWEDIAARAGVGVGTVYRHFRGLDELLPACGALTWQKLDLPDPAVLDGPGGRRRRLERLARALFALYARGEAELRNIRDEADLHPALEDARAQVEGRIDALVAAAEPDQARRPLVRALTDLDAWRALRRAGVEDPASAVAGMLAAQRTSRSSAS